MELPEIVTCYFHDMNPDQRETRIKKIRDRAEEIRAETAEIRNPKIRASMLNIATSYDKVADSLARFLAKRDSG
jgi:plasmid stabilization system protein ParE